MQTILSVKQMRESDAATINKGTPGRELMYRAGVEILSAVENQRTNLGRVGIICGTGNNAGDGYVIALLLKGKGVDCCILLTEERFSDDGQHYFDMCLDRNIPYEVLEADADFSSYDTLFDCVYGTGFHGKVGAKLTNIIKAVNATREKGTFVVSVDINSGLNGNTGMTELCVESDMTVSVGNYQPGHFLNMAKDCMKKHVNCPIGIEPLEENIFLFERDDVQKCFPSRKNFSNKGTYGYIALIGGSLKYSGAIRLAALAEKNVRGEVAGKSTREENSLACIATTSLRSGAGVVTIATPKTIAPIVASQILESTVFPLSDNDGEICFNADEIDELIGNKKAIAFGMGIGKSEETKKLLNYLLNSYKGILIVDADGLNCLSEITYENVIPKLILTPHIKEFSRLSGRTIDEIQHAPIETAVEYARINKVILLLKGASTIITDGEKTYIVDRGCSGMATAGSGDVLSGVLAAICSYNNDRLLEAVAAGAYINGAAGELAQEAYGEVSMLAGDTATRVAVVIKEIVNN